MSKKFTDSKSLTVDDKQNQDLKKITFFEFTNFQFKNLKIQKILFLFHPL